MKQLLITLVFVALCAPVRAALVLDVHGPAAEQLQAPGPVRWESLLQRYPWQQWDANWSALSKVDDEPAMQALRRHVLDRLDQLADHFARKGDYRRLASARELAAQLAPGQLALIARQPVSFDLDVVRVHPRHNPLLNGHYRLYPQPRPTQVFVAGLALLPGPRPFVGGAYAHDYGTRLGFMAGAERNWLWVLQPNGERTRAPIDRFNPDFVGVAPGATLYVGFATLPRAFAGLEQDIMTLLANRLPQ